MNTSKHTPGPWHVGSGEWPKENGSIMAVYTEWHIPIALAYSTHQQGSEIPKTQQQANARLIAAAPDLLAALEGMVERYTSLVNCGDCGFWNPEEEAPVISARAAIAKAKGESK